MSPVRPLPETGRPREQILQEMQSFRSHDVPWKDGKVFSLVYYAGEDVLQMAKDASMLYFSENALNPTAFPSLRRMETDVVAMTASLLGGDEDTVGNMTSGGTESLLLAVKTARDWGREHRKLTGMPEMVLPETAHPAFEKAAHYFDVKSVRVSVREDFRADPEAMQKAITDNTVLMVGSAPSYPQGVVDPIPELAAIAKDHGILFHVDSCVGGFILPFIKELGYKVPEFDLRVPGVTSISADVHKYGYAAKGASVILYRNSELRRYQFFAEINWSGGIYASPSLAGTRPAGPIAAAWAVMNYLGRDGYLRLAKSVMETVEKIRAGVQLISGVEILGDPDASILALASKEHDIYEIADELEIRGWHMDRQHRPPSLHLTITPAHAPVAIRFLEDLAESVDAVSKPNPARWGRAALVKGTNALVRVLPRPVVSKTMALAPKLFKGSAEGGGGRAAPMYGLMGSLPNRSDVKKAVLELLDQIFRPLE